MTATHRPYAGEQDYAQMRELVTQIYARGGPPVYATVGDLDWWRFTDEDDANIQRAELWFDPHGALLALAWPSGEQVDLLVHPDHRDLDAQLLVWAEEASGGLAKLRAWSFDDDAPRRAALQARGFAATEEYLSFRYRELAEPPDLLPLPPGFATRSLLGADEVEERVAAHRDAFAPSKMTVRKHLSVMHAPTYRADLDLLVIGPDDSFVAFCIVWYDAVNRLGEFEPVGTRQAYQRRGLARALMHEGLRRLHALGATAACLWSWWEDDGPRAFYESLGFRELARCRAWEKQLAPAESPRA